MAGVIFPEATGHNAALVAALHEFAEAPGRYAVRRREPALLFQSIREVLMVAAQRSEGVANELAAESARAACVFVKAALLREGANHYALLGLDAKADDAAVKQHYRLMMRLIHPDFAAASAVVWPADAATRVNLAYNVLSSAVQRREYDAALKDQSAGALKPTVVAADASANVRTAQRDPKASEKRTESARRKLRSVVAVCGIAGVVLLVAVVLMFDRGAQTELVQRKSASPSAKQANGSDAPVAAAEAVSLTLPDLTANAREAALLAGNVRLGGAPVIPAVDKKPLAKSNFNQKSKAVEAEIDAAPVPARKATKGAAEAETHADTGEMKDSKPKPVAAGKVAGNSSSETAAAISDAPVILRAATRADTSHLTAEPIKDKGASPGITFAEVQPLIAALLQQLESGRGNNVMLVLDREARRDPSSLAFASYYDGFVNGARSVRVSQVDLKPEPGNGRLLVTGYVRVELGEGIQQTKRLALRAEFSSRAGAIAMTRLTGTEAADR